MRIRNTIFPVLLALAAIAGVVSLHCCSGSSKAQRVFRISPKEIERIVLISNGKGFDLQKEGGSWMVAYKAERDVADNSVMESLLDCIGSLHYFGKIPASEFSSREEREVYGLGTPKNAILLRTPHGEEKLFLGSEAAFPGRVYATFDPDGDVYVVDSSLQSFLEMNRTAFRDRTLSVLSPEQVDSFLIKNNLGEISLVRSPAGWQIKKPLSDHADADVVRKYLVSLLKVPVAGFISDEEREIAAPGVTEGVNEITFRCNGLADPNILRIGSPVRSHPDLIFAYYSPRNAMVLLPTLIEGLVEIGPDHFRDKSLSRIDLAVVDRIKKTSPETKQQWDRDSDSKWKKENSAEATDPARVAHLVKMINSAQIEDFKNYVEWDADIVAEIEFFSVLDEEKFGGKEISLARVGIGKPKEGEKSVWVRSDRGIVVISAADAAAILDALQNLEQEKGSQQ